MHAFAALLLVLAASARAQPRDRAGFEREIDNHAPKIQDFVLNDEYVALQKNRAKLVTKLRPEEPLVQDNVILESNVVRIVRPTARRRVQAGDSGELVRRRRGYNLENVQVPARYPYLAVPGYFSRFRRWG